jgi:hypothetical protein
MSEEIWEDQSGLGLYIAKLTGPERNDGGTRTQIEIYAERSGQLLRLTLGEMIALSGGFWHLLHASNELPLCLRSDCHHVPLFHGRYADCPGDARQ